MDGKLNLNSVYLLKNKSGLPALEAWSHCHIFDHTAPIARDYWTEMCLNMTRSGVIDGCGADASWQDGIDQAKAWGLTPETAAEWSSGHKRMMRQTTSLLGEGLLLGKDPWEVGDYVNGALHEGCAATEETILTLQNLTAQATRTGKRLVYECHGVCSGNGFTDQLAAFLIGAGQYHYYGCGGWNDGDNKGFADHRPAVFDKKLGRPQGAGEKVKGVWQRDFQHAKVRFDSSTNKGTISWEGDLAIEPRRFVASV